MQWNAPRTTTTTRGRSLQPVQAASLLRTALPVEAARSLTPERPGSSARPRLGSRAVGPVLEAIHEEDQMTSPILLAVGLVAT